MTLTPVWQREPDRHLARLKGDLCEHFDQIAGQIRDDRDWIVAHWRVWRDRTPLVELFTDPLREIDIDTLLSWTPEQLSAVDALSRELSSLWLWARFTQAMPETLGDQLELAADRLVPLLQKAARTLRAA